jgi:hypothetical protein
MTSVSKRFTWTLHLSVLTILAMLLGSGAGPASARPAGSSTVETYPLGASTSTPAALPDRTPPTVVSRYPGNGGSATSSTNRITAKLSEDVDPASVRAQLVDGAGKQVPASVDYNPAARTVVLTPQDAVAGGTYQATVSDAKDAAGNVMAPVSWRFAAPTVAGCPRTLFRDDDAPAGTTTAASPIELGMKFRADRDGYVTGVRFYKGPGNTGAHLGRLWSSRGEKLAEVTFSGESTSGWQQAQFSAPVRIAAGWTYVVSYYAPVGNYSYTYDYFGSNITRSPLTALVNGADGGNGVYRTGSSGFPTATYRSTNYWVEPVFDGMAGQVTCPATIFADHQAPAVTASSATASIEVGVKFRADRDGFIQGVRFFKGAGNTGVHIGRLWTSAGQKLAETTFVAESATGWQQAWFAQPVAISAGTTYVASYYVPTGKYSFTENRFASAGATRGPLTALRNGVDGGNGVYLYGTGGFPTNTYNASDYGVDVMFTGQAAVPCGPCTLWSGTGEPTTQYSTDTSAVELGVRIRPMRNGYIKGVRFYKGAANTGVHIGRLWSSAGANLAQATFTDESAAGWQQVLFSTPVAVTAGQTYVASYYAPVGRFAYDTTFFGRDGVTAGPLAAVQDGVGGGNGVYRYGAGGGFPASAYGAANYWVDAVYETNATDTGPPVLVNQSPGSGATAVPVTGRVNVRFGEAVTGSTVRIALRAGSTNVAGTVTYNSSTWSAVFRPTNPLAYSTTYQVTVSDARDGAGTVMAPVTWNFTTGPDPAAGPGGPIAVITSAANPYSSYYAEILRAEGVNAFSTLSLNGLTASTLGQYDVVILGDIPLNDAQAAMLTTWVNGGGKLIAMSPDARLAPLLGLTGASGTLANGYLAVDPATPPGAGITEATMQFHGTADRYTLSGATMVARLYNSATASTNNPAVTMRTVGSSGGRAAAFTYDLARSVALTRQGNPAWAGQERDGLAPIRSDDMFFGGSGSPDWIDLNKVAIPQADEQQRLLINLIEHLNLDRKPIPRFWYFPGGANAIVVATGDDEAPGTHGTSGRYDRYLANSTPGCRTDDWQCLRFTSYLWPSVGFTDAQGRAYHEQGFEVALHPENGCTNFTPASLEATYANQLADWATKYQSLPPPTTSRYHCISYSDWDSQPKTEFRHGIRFDTNYYHWPGSWVQDRPGFMTGSGMPMRFTDTGGQMIDVYQAPTQLTDESQQSYPFTPNTLFARAMGPEGYYGMFVANMHDSNKPTSYEDDQLVASAQNFGVPVITARDALEWLDGRAASSFRDLTWSAAGLSFTIDAAATARRMVAALPTTGAGGTVLTGLTHGGVAVPVSTATVKGIEYAFFPALSGAYSAAYGTPGPSVVAAAPQAAVAADSAEVNWSTSVAGSTEIEYGTSPTSMNRKSAAGKSRKHRVKVTGLAPGTRYYYRVASRDAAGRDATWPAPGQVSTFTTPPRDGSAPTVADLKVTPLPDSTVRVTWRTNEPSESRVLYGYSSDRLDQLGLDEKLVTDHIVVLANVPANAMLSLRVVSTDTSGNQVTFPAAGASPVQVFSSAPGVADQTKVGFKTGTVTGPVLISGDGLANLTLSDRTGSGTFTSRVLDATVPAAWKHARWDATVPSGSRMVVSVRSGNSPTPDASWSGWSGVPAAQAALKVPVGRFLQYRIEMTGSRAGAPVVRWIGFVHDKPLPGSERREQKRVG